MSHWQMDLSLKLIKQEFGRQLLLSPEASKEIQFYFYFDADELKICPEFNGHVFKGQNMVIAKINYLEASIETSDFIFTKGFATEWISFIRKNLGKIESEADFKIKITSLTKIFCKSNLIAISSKSGF